MLLRLLSLVLLSAPVIVATLWFSGNPGQVVLEWMGWHIETNIPILLLVLLVVFVVLFMVEHGLTSLTTLPGRWRRSRQVKEMERGIGLLIDALDAAAAGDVENGRRLGGESARHLRRPDLAQRLDRLMPRPAPSPAAVPEGKGAKAKPAWWKRFSRKKPVLPPPRRSVPLPVEPAPIPEIAVPVAAVAPPPEPPAPSAFDGVAFDGVAFDSAALLAQAAALVPTDPAQARQLLDQVLTAMPGHKGAAHLALALDGAAGNKDQARSVLLQLWRVKPSYALLQQAAPLWAGEAAAAQSAWLQRLVKTNPDHADSHLALGAAAVAAQQWGPARLHVVAAIKAAPSVTAFGLMAEIEQREGTDPAAAALWQRRIAEAPPPSQWQCSACGAVAQDWTASCPQCTSIGTLA